MIDIEAPGQDSRKIKNIVVDLNGTLTVDGRIHPRTKDRINLLAKRTSVYVLTTDTRGDSRDVLRKVRAEIISVEGKDTGKKKAEFVKKIGPGRTVAIGNGYNDRLMVKEASIGICILGREGATSETIQNSDLVFPTILDAFDFLLKPLRQKATLRK
ncbi:MAG: ATPase P [Proteobacteria bacterium]|nr:ATPase P [Pseudomonadota bacterium]